MSGALLLHGFTGVPSSWDGVRALVQRNMVEVRPVLLGHGPRGPLDPDRTMEEEVDRLADIAAVQLHGPRVLVGYSLGARLALGLLVRHGHLFSRAILIGGRAGLTDEGEKRERLAQDERWAQLLLREGVPAFADAWARLPLFASQQKLAAAQQQGERARRESHTAEGLARSLRCHSLARMPWDLAALAAVRVPVTCIAGALDPKFIALGRELVQALPHGRLVVVEDAGHNVALERPEAVARIWAEEHDRA